MRTSFAAGVLVCLVAVLTSQCSRTDEQKAPVQVLLSFVTAIERSIHEPAYRKQAFEWLDEASQQELNERASLTRSLAGSELEGWEMLVPGRLRVTARDLRRQRLRATIEGDHATVSLSEDNSIDLVREPDGWRVQLLSADP